MIKNRLFITGLIGVYIIFSISFGIYLWMEHRKTVVTYSEKKMLDSYDLIYIIGDKGFAPFSYTNTDGLYSGYEADLILALEGWLEKEFQYRQKTWNDAVNMLASGEVDAISGMRITSERETLYEFTDPYIYSVYAFVIGTGHDISNLLEKEIVTITVQRGSATYDYLIDNLYADNMSILFVDSPADALHMLVRKEADIWFENHQVARHTSMIEESLDLLNFHEIEESKGKYAMAFGKDHEKLLPVINKALENLKIDGTIAELDNKWFGFTEYPSDDSSEYHYIPVVIYVVVTVFTLIIFWNGMLIAKVEKKTLELRQGEEKFRATFEGTRDAIITTTSEGKLIDCNRNALKLFRFSSKEEFLSKELRCLFSDTQSDGEDSNLKLAFLSEEPFKEINEDNFEWVGYRNDGSAFVADVSLAVYLLKDNIIAQFNISDITERKEYQSQLEYLSLYDQLTGLYNRNFFEAELIRLSDGRFYPISLISCDLDGLKLINDTLGHQEGDRLLKACARVLKGSLRDSDILARVGGDEFSAILPNTDNITGEKIARRIRDNLFHYNSKHSELPMGISLGVATAEDNTTLLGDLFKQADDLMYRDKLYSSNSIHSRVVKGLMAALAERDYITEGHVRRLEKFCRDIGEKLNLTSKQLADLALLAKVHDLGKVGIPDHILFKPGALNKEEWEIMKQHSEKGFRIAKASPDLADVAELILKHHERWDGKGYPLGLEKEEIPLECRILSVVDAYDAMTNERPYARTKSHQEALKELKDGSDSQFDPNIVDLFLSVYSSYG